MDFIRALGMFYPNVRASCFGDVSDYSNLQWESGDPLPSEADLALVYYHSVKADKIRELSDSARERIIRPGFISVALGHEYLYDSEEVDQLNLLGSYVSSMPTPTRPGGVVVPHAARLPSAPPEGVLGPKEYYMHTHEQINTVMNDGIAHKLKWLLKFNTLRAHINDNNLTIEQIESITIDSILT